LGIPLPFTGEFEVIIMIAVVTGPTLLGSRFYARYSTNERGRAMTSNFQYDSGLQHRRAPFVAESVLLKLSDGQFQRAAGRGRGDVAGGCLPAQWLFEGCRIAAFAFSINTGVVTDQGLRELKAQFARTTVISVLSRNHSQASKPGRCTTSP
jgi:hypothetical protein